MYWAGGNGNDITCVASVLFAIVDTFRWGGRSIQSMLIGKYSAIHLIHVLRSIRFVRDARNLNEMTENEICPNSFT